MFNDVNCKNIVSLEITGTGSRELLHNYYKHTQREKHESEKSRMKQTQQLAVPGVQQRSGES